LETSTIWRSAPSEPKEIVAPTPTAPRTAARGGWPDRDRAEGVEEDFSTLRCQGEEAAVDLKELEERRRCAGMEDQQQDFGRQ